ncbi:MAG: polymer-forming cytoskeletal protein [Bacteroidota bacterium]
MFNNKPIKMASPESNSVNILGTGTEITGNIKSNGDFRIDGVLKGNIEVKGKLVVGPSGLVDGEIYCQTADISGNLKGKINVSELLTLKSTSRINGDIITGKIAIEPDAQFTGTCSMGGGVVKNLSGGAEKSNAIKEVGTGTGI